MSEQHYVADTCTLHYFYHDLKNSRLLHQLFFPCLYIVPQVRDELLRLATKKNYSNLILKEIDSGFLSIKEVDIDNPEVQKFISEFSTSLDIGERFSCAIALSNDWVLLTDDWVAHQVVMFAYISIMCRDAKWILLEARKKRIIGQKESERLNKMLEKAKKRY
ncbi:hypothetical protein [Candidatus Oleimmundimicrobium sp.]|uniref:hypothetical protein n=1 Tax=Candidatus Oleimmundimicrobium sp. TaxID=3060597 RepID=UPI002726D067|nr:hypothetical protein [Candidatus Oleimmundimicrobium sp.]MDO8885824.1 hypothetical protein [Candidatus Oleimmundimicrobium sp.]